MKKSSLGRRSSVTGRTSTRTSTVRDIASARKDHSGIPVRARSTEVLNTMCQSYSAKRSSSSQRCTDLMTPQATNRRLTFNDRLSSISRKSSVGGTKSRKDNRPLQDKEWQAQAQHKIEKLLHSDPEGSNILVSYGTNRSIKPLSLKLFIEIVDHFFHFLDANVVINKQNYMNEIPYNCKRLLYKGKIEKSWLISVNTPHSWIHALGLLEFLATCVSCLKVENPINLLYPVTFNVEDDCDDDDPSFWNFKLLLSYFWESYCLEQPEGQNYLDEQIIKLHIEEGLSEKLESAMIETNKEEEKYEKMTMATANVCQECRDTNDELGQIENKIDDLEEYCGKVINANNKTMDAIDRKTTKIASLEEETKLLEKRQSVLNDAISQQKVSHEDIKRLQNSQIDIQKEIESIQKCINAYEDVLFKDDLEIVQIKNKLEATLLDLNVKIAEFISIEPEISQATISNGIDQIDQDQLENTKKILSNLQIKYEQLLVTLETEIKNIQEITKEKMIIVTEIEKDLEEKEEILKSIKNSQDSSINSEEKKVHELEQNLYDYKLKIKQMEDPDVKLDELIVEVEKKRIKIKEMERGIEIFDERAKIKIENRMKILNERFYPVVNERLERYRTLTQKYEKK